MPGPVTAMCTWSPPGEQLVVRQLEVDEDVVGHVAFVFALRAAVDEQRLLQVLRSRRPSCRPRTAVIASAPGVFTLSWFGAAGERDEDVLAVRERVAAGQVGQLHRRLRVVDRLVGLVVEDEVHVRAARGRLPVLHVELHLEVARLGRRDHLVCRGGERIFTVGSGGAGSGLAVPCIELHGRRRRAAVARRRWPRRRRSRAGAALSRRAAAAAGEAEAGGSRCRRRTRTRARPRGAGEGRGGGGRCAFMAGASIVRRPQRTQRNRATVLASRQRMPHRRALPLRLHQPPPGRPSQGIVRREGVRELVVPALKDGARQARRRQGQSRARARRAASTCARRASAIVQEPEHVAYGGVTLADVDEIADAAATRRSGRAARRRRASRSTEAERRLVAHVPRLLLPRDDERQLLAARRARPTSAPSRSRSRRARATCDASPRTRRGGITGTIDAEGLATRRRARGDARLQAHRRAAAALPLRLPRRRRRALRAERTEGVERPRAHRVDDAPSGEPLRRRGRGDGARHASLRLALGLGGG